MRLTLPTSPDDALRESRRRDAPTPVASGAGVLPEQVLREAESASDVHVLSEVLSGIRLTGAVFLEMTLRDRWSYSRLQPHSRLDPCAQGSHLDIGAHARGRVSAEGPHSGHRQRHGHRSSAAEHA
jgi:hypothetical protein